jgi:hypothetical protein
VIIMLDGRSLCTLAILMTLIIPAAAQSQNAQTYSSADVDSKLETLRANVSAEIDAKLNAIKSSVETDLDKKLDALKSSLSTDTTSKLDALKSSLQASSYSQKAIDDKLSALGQREEAEIKALDSKIPTAPWWGAAVLGAILGAIFGASSSFAVARYSAGRLDAQTADTLVDEYVAIFDKAAATRDLLKNPNKIGTDTDKNVIINIGNWYERVADRWRSHRADPAILESNNFTEILLEFWNSVEALKTAQPPINLTEQQHGWPALYDFWKRHQPAGGVTA